MKNDLPNIAPTRAEIARTLEDALALQRAAYFAHPVPTLAERKADLRTLQRFIRENKQALCDAISADYGHRSQHETLLAEVFPAMDGISHVIGSLRKWMRPQRRSVDLRNFIGASNRVIPQPLGVVGIIVPWNFPLHLSLIPLDLRVRRRQPRDDQDERELAPPGRVPDREDAGLLPAREAALLRRDRRRRHRVLQAAVRPPAVHRLGPDRPLGDGRRGRQPRARHAGAGRQGAGHPVRRLPAAPGRRTHPVRQADERRPDLHDGRPRVDPARQGRRVRGGRARDRQRALSVHHVDRLHLGHRRALVRPPGRRAGGRQGARRHGDPGHPRRAVRPRHAQDVAAHRAQRAGRLRAAATRDLRPHPADPRLRLARDRDPVRSTPARARSPSTRSATTAARCRCCSIA